MKKRSDKPNVFNYRQSQEYLAALLLWYKEQGISMRNLAKKLNVSPALLSLITKNKRPLTEENIDIWAKTFGWNSQEVTWLKQLVLLGHSPVEKKQEALENLSRFQVYQKNSSQEVLTFKYLKRWWNVAIREMSELPEFKEEENWIQEKLLFKVPLPEIRKSLNFLNKHQLLGKYGEFRTLDCQGDVYKLSLSSFHEQILSKAVESIYKVPSDNRYILGQTMVISSDKFPEAKAILKEAMDKIMQLHEPVNKSGEVYHFSFLGFPLTGNED